MNIFGKTPTYKIKVDMKEFNKIYVYNNHKDEFVPSNLFMDKNIIERAMKIRKKIEKEKIKIDEKQEIKTKIDKIDQIEEKLHILYELLKK